MKLAFYSNYLNHHQVLVADALYALLGDEYRFVATLPRDENELKGGADYSSRPYCILAGESEAAHAEALALAENADTCVFGACSQEYAVARAKSNRQALSFECAERWLKHGLLTFGSPVFRKWLMNYYRYYRKANFHKLCCSAFAAGDDERLGAYRGKHYKWGYFTQVDTLDDGAFESNGKEVRLMWCARFIPLKHAELPIKMAKRLYDLECKFILDYYGDGPERVNCESMVEKLGLKDVVRFYGNRPNDEILRAMTNHDVLLFTSNRFEGWGAVMNEAMANGCAVVASDAIGSTPYLLRNGYNGFKFKSGSVDSLTEQVAYLILHPTELQVMKRNAYSNMQRFWSPKNAAQSLLQLIDDLKNGKETSIKEGPCSKA